MLNSLTYRGVAVTLLAWLLQAVGSPIANEELENAITVILAIVGAVMTLWGRWRAGGVNVFGGRIK